MVPLILALFLCTLGYAQHISKFTSPPGEGQDSNFNLPTTHSFQVLFSTQDFLSLGGVIPDNSLKGPNFDFAGYVPIVESSKYGYLSINSEMAPGAVTVLDIEFDDVLGSWSWNTITSEIVDFPLFSFPTIANCSGTVTPWNTIITCEEYTSIELDADGDYPWITSTDLDGDGYDDFGWSIEIDPATKTIINQPGGRDDKDKLWAMGNFKHENAVISSDHRTVYQGADAPYENVETREGDGYLFKFIAARAQDLSEGDLYVYKGDKVSTHEWIKLANGTQEEQNTTIAQCKTLGATAFGGIEDVEINPKDGLIYFAVKREYIGDISRKGIIYRFKDSSSGISDFEIFAGGGSVYDGVEWGEGNDNLVFDDLGNLWVAQDGSFSRGDENYIWVIENGHTQLAPKVKIFARTPGGSEPTGLTFSPDFRYIFMSIQHPRDNNSSQTDVFGTPVSFNEDVVLVLARNEHLGKDLTLEDQDVMISQYYHDLATDSKWIEIKNISGKVIPEGSYFIDLYDDSVGDISSDSPKASQAIPAMEIDEVILFKNSTSPSQPDSNSLGDAIQIESAICDFDGNDVVLITTTPGSKKYKNRKDIIGYTPLSQWGQNTSMIRGGNSLELPERDFDANNWIEIESLEEVSQADKNKNIALGTQETGPTFWNGTFWSNLEPDRSRNGSFTNVYDASQGSIEAYNLIVETGVAVNFNDDGTSNSIIVHNNLDIEGSLTIGDTESLIIMSEGDKVQGFINKIEKSTNRNHPNDITYWSSSVQDEQIEDVFLSVDPGRIFYYDQSKYVSDETYWDVWQTASGNMNVGQGYAAEGPSGQIGIHEISFSGKPNYGTIPTTIMQFNNDDGANENMDNDYNLIGNPYPSAIDIEAFLKTNGEVNGVIDGTVYLWTHATELADTGYSNSDYVTYNYVGAAAIDENIEVSRNIGSGQGFFVRALKAAPVIFDQSMILLNANDQFFKISNDKNAFEKDRMWINLKGSDNSFKQILIGFSEGASDEMDSGYDAIYLDGGRSSGFYSLLNERKLAIQGLGAFEASKKIELGFEVKTEGSAMTIEIDRTEGVLNEAEVILVDHELSVMHDLKEKAYHFNYAAKGEFLERFSIIFNSAILLNEDISVFESINIYVLDENLFVDSPEEITDIEIYDILGRKLISDRPESKSFEMSLDELEKGTFFIVKLKGINGFELTKKMIKY